MLGFWLLILLKFQSVVSGSPPLCHSQGAFGENAPEVSNLDLSVPYPARAQGWKGLGRCFVLVSFKIKEGNKNHILSNDPGLWSQR